MAKILKTVRRYQGIVTNQLSGDTKQTHWYNTYKDAHNAAEKLCKRTYNSNGTIDIKAKTQ